MSEYTKKELKQKLKIATSQDILRLSVSAKILKKIKNKYMASGVIIKIEDLNGDTIVDNTMIIDGFSDDTINSLYNDIKKTSDFRINLNKLN